MRLWIWLVVSLHVLVQGGRNRRVPHCVVMGRVAQDKITPLYKAAQGQHSAVVQALIEAKAEVDIECRPGDSARVLPYFLPAIGSQFHFFWVYRLWLGPNEGARFFGLQRICDGMHRIANSMRGAMSRNNSSFAESMSDVA
jgi:hypothetical protein